MTRRFVLGLFLLLSLSHIYAQPESVPVLGAVDASPDGTLFAFGGRFGNASGEEAYGFTVVNREGALITHVTTENSVLGLEWHPNGSLLATYSGDSDDLHFVRIWSLPEQRYIAEYADPNSGHETYDPTPHWSPDGSKLALHKGFDVYVWDTGSGELVGQIRLGEAQTDFIPSITWTGDSKSLLLLNLRNQIYSYDLEGRIPEIVYTFDMEERIREPSALSTYGKTLAAAYEVRPDIVLIELETFAVHQLRRHTSSYAPRDVKWSSPTMLVVLSHEGSVEIWDVTTDRLIQEIRETTLQYPRTFSLSPDGNYLLVVGRPELPLPEVTPEAIFEQPDASMANPAFTVLVRGAAILIDLSQVNK
jgi:WD40 repeat protein